MEIQSFRRRSIVTLFAEYPDAVGNTTREVGANLTIDDGSKLVLYGMDGKYTR